MGLVAKTYTFSAGATIIASEHNSNFDTLYNDYNGNISNANISNSAAIGYSKLALTGAILNSDLAGSIADSKLSQIVTASKVHGTSITGLASLPAGAGLIPTANLPTLNPHGVEIFTSSDTFTAPEGITTVYLTMVGGGGGGGGSTNDGVNAGGGGGAGAWVVNRPYTVVPGNNYTITIPSAASGGADQNSNGSDGGTVVFDSLSIVGGSGGLGSSGGSGVGGAGGVASLNASGATVGTGAMAGGNGGTRSGANSGAGGSTPLGTGAASSSTGAGTAATGYGGGGSGAGGGGTGNKSGGAGGTGIVIVIY